MVQNPQISGSFLERKGSQVAAACIAPSPATQTTSASLALYLVRAMDQLHYMIISDVRHY